MSDAAAGAGVVPPVAEAADALGAAPDAEVHVATAANLAKLTSYSWNVFRYIGDYLHLFGIFALLATLFKNKSCQGISRSTQILYFCVFITRYLDLVDHSQTAYLVFFKMTYILSSIVVLVVFWKLDKTYERQKDTCSLPVIFIPCITAAVLMANEYSVLEMLWSFSQFLEGFAMVPQYIFCYRDKFSSDMGVTMYVLSLGGYRVFYAANWIYKKVQMPMYSDIQSWTGGIIEISFFTDYLLSRVTGFSLLRAMVLKVDEKINELQDKVEMKVLGSSRSTRNSGGEQGESELRQRRGRGGDEDPIDV